jgi:enamine deaminase RidA (YjgF/YER057c/UK114 family)
VRCGPFIFTSRQVGTDPGGTRALFEIQAYTALSQLIATVELAGGNSSTLLKVNAYLASIDDRPVFDCVYRTLITAAPMPARRTIAAGSLVPPTLIEVEAIALVAPPLAQEHRDQRGRSVLRSGRRSNQPSTSTTHRRVRWAGRSELA